jgi:hypothetical protein
VEPFARSVVLALVVVSLLQVAGVGGRGPARSPAEAGQRVTAWWRAKLIGG